MQPKPDLHIDIGGIQLKNPVITASGTFGYGREFKSLVNLDRLGAIIVKGLSLSPAKGNPPPRIVETSCGMLNAIGLENVGLDVFIEKKCPFFRRLQTPVLVNIYGQTADQYEALAERLDTLAEVAGIEVNISCPNVKSGGIAFGVVPEAAQQVVAAVRRKTVKPLMVKLSPNVTDITEIAKTVEGAGADAISLINTITGMAVDIESRRPCLANITGGYSGPGIKPVALRMVWQVASAVKVPIVGIGGIMSAADAVEFLIVGASAIQVGTANFVDPGVTMEIIDGIEAYLIKHKLASVADLVGSLVLEPPE